MTLPKLGLQFPRFPLTIARVVFAACCVVSASAAQAPPLTVDQHIDRLFTGKSSATLSVLAANASTMSAEDRFVYVTIGLELGATPRERIAELRGMIADQRAFINGHRFIAASLIDAHAAAGQTGPGEAVLRLLDEMAMTAQPLDKVDVASIRVALALAANRLKDAQELLGRATSALKSAVPDAGYETWHSRLIRHRLNRLERHVTAALGSEQFGPACWAWLEADKAKTDAAYAYVAATHAGTVYAHASIVERARLRLDGSDPKRLVEAMSMLSDHNVMAGNLGVEARLVYADAAILSGNLNEAAAALDSAMAQIRTPPPLPALSDVQRQKIALTAPLHRYNERRYPTWVLRPTGVLMIPDLTPQTSATQRYQIMMRQVTLARVAGQRQVASALATAMVRVDEIDRDLEARGVGTGGHILARYVVDDDLLADAKAFDALPLGVQARIHMGLACYSVYDWAGSELWLTRSLADTAKSPPPARDGVRVVLAMAKKLQGKWQAAMDLLTAINLPPDQPIYAAWDSARWCEMQTAQALYYNDYRRAAQPLMELAKRSSDSDSGQRAWLGAASLAIQFDIDLAEQLGQSFVQRYPTSIYAASVESDLMPRIRKARQVKSATTALRP